LRQNAGKGLINNDTGSLSGETVLDRENGKKKAPLTHPAGGKGGESSKKMKPKGGNLNVDVTTTQSRVTKGTGDEEILFLKWGGGPKKSDQSIWRPISNLQSKGPSIIKDPPMRKNRLRGQKKVGGKKVRKGVLGKT